MAPEQKALRNWVDQQWPHLTLNDFTPRTRFNGSGEEPPVWQPLRGDAGFRRYFRLASEPPLLAVLAPPASEDSEHFISLARHMRSHGVLAPAIACADVERGFLLIEDFGPDLLLSALTEDSADAHYAEAIRCLLSMQKMPVDALGMQLYDSSRLIGELRLFGDWFVERLLARPLDEGEREMLDTWFTYLTESALEQPQVFVHRDFHSRNLVLREGGPPGVIDFQDAVVGPITYDLVSLLRDCYIAWPEQRVKEWARSYARAAMNAGILGPVDESTFLRWFDLMGLQRHIKVLGVFARLSLRDDKHGYLEDLPLVIAYTLSVARRYSVGEPFVTWFEEALMPLIPRQTWYREVEIA